MLSPDGKKQVTLLPILAVLSTIFFVLRLIRKRKALGLDDGLLCLAMVLLYADTALGLVMALKAGEGLPIKSLTAEQLNLLLILAWAPQIVYTVLISTIKFSILVSYYLIFGGLRWFRLAIYAIGVLEGMWFIGVLVTVIFECTPVSKSWQPSLPGHCINFPAFLWGNSISNTVLDYMILFLPVVPVLKLQMSTGHKALVLLAFSLGSLASISSTIRAAWTAKFDPSRMSETIFEGGIWTYIEPHAALIAACLPFLAKTFSQIFMKWSRLLRSIGEKKTAALSSLQKKPQKPRPRQENSSSKSTQRAAFESYDLSIDNTKDGAGFKESEDSIRQLV
ncbi:MAG: hypothetical protein Q9180_000407 [Flavoplaca navasiana]